MKKKCEWKWWWEKSDEITKESNFLLYFYVQNVNDELRKKGKQFLKMQLEEEEEE